VFIIIFFIIKTLNKTDGQTLVFASKVPLLHYSNVPPRRHSVLSVSIVGLGFGCFNLDRISVPVVVFRKAEPLNLNPSYIRSTRTYAGLTAEIFIGAESERVSLASAC
jgi:hypothetical protein